ncbi:MAG TPA: hypothetical protein VM093_04820 [Aeromicrobium sp.]|nr:hypothetical protein [Aeromicrobium sp.]
MRARLGLLLVVGLLVGFLASCGEPEKLTAKTLFPAVSKAQAEAGSSHMAMKLTTPSGQSFESHGQMRLGKRPSDTAMAMTVNGGTGSMGTIELRLVGGNFYIALGALTQNKFAKIDLSDKSNPIARQYGDIVKNVDPARQVEQYRDAITKFDSSAQPVEIDGVKTQPYRITIDPKKAGSLESFRKADLPSTINFTLYIDSDNLPRRMVSKVPSPAGPTRLQMDYTHWGEKVTIQAPKASNVVDQSLFDQVGKTG